jgi:hypothetical protein
MMVVVLYVDYYGRIPITFYGAVATNELWHETRLFKLSGYISNDSILLTLWLNLFVTASNDGSRVTPSPARVGPHPKNRFTVLFFAPMLLNPRSDGTNSFVVALLISGKMPSNCTIRTDDLVPSLHLTNGCALLLMLFGPSLLRYGASATTNYMDTMDNYPSKQNAKSL